MPVALDSGERYPAQLGLVMSQRDVIAGDEHLHLFHAHSVDQHAIGAAEILQNDLPIIDDKTGMPARDQGIVEHELAAVSAAHHGDAGYQLEVLPILETQPNTAAGTHGSWNVSGR
jgi:hypothetical protein